jgi:hypothetical protein
MELIIARIYCKVYYYTYERGFGFILSHTSVGNNGTTPALQSTENSSMFRRYCTNIKKNLNP